MLACDVVQPLELGRAPFRRRLVEHAVDVGVAVLGPEALGGIDRLVDDHAIRHVRAMQQFVGGDAQGGALDLVDFFHGAIDESRQCGVKLTTARQHAADEVLEVLEISHFM